MHRNLRINVCEFIFMLHFNCFVSDYNLLVVTHSSCKDSLILSKEGKIKAQSRELIK